MTIREVQKAPPTLPAVDTAALDAAVADLRAGLPSWLDLPLGERIALVRAARRRVGEEAPGIVAAGCAAQGIEPGGPWVGELWGGLSPLVLHLRAFEDVLGRVAAGREPLPSIAVRIRRGGQVLVDVVPATRMHQMLFSGWGVRAQVWMQPGVSVEEVRAGAARAYRGAGFDNPGVALVLGAGNFAFLPATDALHMLLGEGCVVALKLNPVNAYLQPFLERIFADFVAGGWLRFVEGGAEAGGYLASHPGVDRLHMTGSGDTYDALVWGVGADAVRNRAAGRPRLGKPFTAELGGVSPVIVVPGPWSASDVRLQADRITFAKLLNCGHSCAAAQVLVLPQGWEPGDALVEQIRARMRTLPPRTPYYPGTEEKVARAVAGQPGVEVLLAPDHRVLVTDLDPTTQASLFHDEVFADVLGVVRLPAPSVAEYLNAATTFANERLAGNLNAALYIHPTTAKHDAPALDRAVAGLRYGAVAVNDAPNWGLMVGYPTWGGFPGNTPEDISSGIGTVGNAFLLPDPQKTVVSAAFHPPIKPLFTSSHRTLATVMRGLVRFEATNDLRALPGVLAAVLRA